MLDAVKTGTALVVSLNSEPGRFRNVGVGEHLVLRFGKLNPAITGLQIHRAQLPAPGWVFKAGAEAGFLLLITDREPVFQYRDAAAHQHALKFWAGLPELLNLLGRAESHHVFHPGAVIPTAIEEQNLASGGEVLHIALEIPLGLLLIRGCAQRHYPATAWVEGLGYPLDRSALASGVPPFKEQDDAIAAVFDPVLHLDQLHLEPGQFFFIELAIEPGFLALRIGRKIIKDWRGKIAIARAFSLRFTCFSMGSRVLFGLF